MGKFRNYSLEGEFFGKAEVFVVVEVGIDIVVLNHDLVDETSQNLDNGGSHPFILFSESFNDVSLGFDFLGNYAVINRVEHVFISQNYLFNH